MIKAADRILNIYKLQFIVLFSVYFYGFNHLVANTYASNTALKNTQIELSFSESLDEVQATIYLAQSYSHLTAPLSDKDFFVKYPRDCKSLESLSYQKSIISLNKETRCVEYVAKIKQRYSSRPLGVSWSSIVTKPNEWLFLPRISHHDHIDINVELPDNTEFSTPWTPSSETYNSYQITASPNSANSMIVIGQFPHFEIKHKQTTLRVAVLPGAKVNSEHIKAWLKQTIDNVSLSYGRFPNPNPQVIIAPVGKAWSYHRSPVPYGRVVRDYGESVEFYVDQRQSLNQFNQDWTATHEFAHLLLPYVNWQNRWLSEGFASYYQNILLARSGIYSEKKAWEKLYAGFRRGQRATPEISPNIASTSDSSANMKVYWSGAALFLLADLELRKISKGTKSLDYVLEELQTCCLPAKRVWSGSQLMRKLDQISDSKVFMKLYLEYGNKPGFLPFEKAFEQLGIKAGYGSLSLDNSDAQKKELRESFFKPYIKHSN